MAAGTDGDTEDDNVEAAEARRISVEEYLEGEAEAEVRHEYVRGEVFAMGDASRVHALLAFRVATALSAAAQGRGCEIYLSDVKVRVEAADAYLYPDVVVACDPEDSDPYVVARPALVVEVLSPSTTPYDRGAKHAMYRSLPSLAEILLVDSQSTAVEHYVRESAATWRVSYYGPGDVFALLRGQAQLEVDALYRGTSLHSGAEPAE